MESTIPQNTVSITTCGGEASSEGGLGKQVVAQDLSRRSYSPTAMFGVAISVGACSLLSPHAGGAAIAAENIRPEAMMVEPGIAAVPEMNAVPTLAALNSSKAPQATSSAVTLQSYTVQEGENLSQIAKIYHVSLQAIASLNNLAPDSILRVGQVISLDVSSMETVPTPVPTLQENAALKKVTMVKVRQDEMVSKLKEQQTKLKKSLLDLRSEEAKVASAPTLSTTTPEPSSVSVATHQVAPGENLSTIARIHGMSPSELASLNNIVNPNLLKANQILKVASPKIAPIKMESYKAIALANPSLTVDSESDAPAPPMPGQAVESRRYIDGLMNDVVKARQKYQSSSISYRPNARTSQVEPLSMPPPSLPVTVPSVGGSVNPEFQARGIPQLRSINSSSSVQVLRPLIASVPTISSPALPRVIARASVGAHAYAPLVQPSARRAVSPEMPTIGAAESYLPRGNGGGTEVAGLIWPAKGVLTSGYGARWGRMHRGVDIAAPVGTPVVAAAAGIVAYSGYNDGGFGYLVEVDHADGTMTRYAHNSRLLVKAGQQVSQGQQISEMGSTGFSTGPHVHFEVHPGGKAAVNPMAYLPANRG